MEKDNFFKNSFILTASNITTGIIGFIFSIYLSKIIGPEGMGLYNLVMPIYNLFICVMTAGVAASISQVSAVFYEKREYRNLKRTIKVVTIFNLLWAMFVAGIVFFTANYIGEYAIKDIRTIDAIKVTCPAMVFIALSNILKGYFWGTSQVTAPAIIDIFEKALRIATVALLIFLFKATDLKDLVMLCYVALALGELQSLLLLYIYYKQSVKILPRTTERVERRSQLLFNVLIISLPLTLNGFLSNIFNTISTLIIPRSLQMAGFRHSVALSMIGKYTGMAMMIIGMPLIVVSSINTLLIPDLSQTIIKGNFYEASVRIKKVLKIAFLLGMATTIICLIVPTELGELFYSRSDLGSYIMTAGLCAPVFFVSVPMNSILNGLNKQGIILRNSMIIAVAELIGLYIFTAIPSINIYGYAITLFLVSVLGIIINMYEIRKHIELNISVYNIIIYVFLGVVSYIIIKNIFAIIYIKSIVVKCILLISVIFGLFIYLGKLGNE